MKVLIISDSHGLTNELLEVKERHKNDVDFMLHLGDSELPSHSEEMSGFSAVRGNCDFDSNYPNDMVILLNGAKVYLTHGHLYNVKMTLMNLKYRAEEVGAKIACFGHSHIAGAEMIEGVLFINPGSFRMPRMRAEKTYVILELVVNQVNVDFYDSKGNVVEELSTSLKI
ncbi:metallophosphoesterase family protein [Bacillus sinesaloumensis]|uniref:metallophosphoesterase family protein n=1 Tax=Litchfieldia sinesaloumensis TaxID=1926280 RepID=UPI0009885EF4|nr:metallophosphoesterase [Bacillus sinesaloumensis]